MNSASHNFMLLVYTFGPLLVHLMESIEHILFESSEHILFESSERAYSIILQLTPPLASCALNKNKRQPIKTGKELFHFFIDSWSAYTIEEMKQQTTHCFASKLPLKHCLFQKGRELTPWLLPLLLRIEYGEIPPQNGNMVVWGTLQNKMNLSTLLDTWNRNDTENWSQGLGEVNHEEKNLKPS